MLINFYNLKIKFTIICTLVLSPCFAQTALIDSLESHLKNPSLSNQNRVNVMNTLSFQYHRSDIAKGLYYARTALKISNQISYKKGTGDAYHYMGVNFWEKGNLDSALFSYEEAISIYDELGLIEKGVRTRMNKAIIFENKDDFSKAITQYERALVLIEENNIEDLAGVVSFNMGIVFNKMGNWTAAIERYFQMVQLAQKVGNKAWEISALQSIGNAYINLEDFERAFDAFRSALEVATKSGNKRQEADAKRGLGKIFSLNNQLDSAYYYFQDALAIQRSLERKRGIALNLISLGEIKGKQGRYKEAISYQTQAFNLYNELQHHSSKAMALLRLGETSLLMNEIKLAESYLKQGTSMLDSMGSLPDILLATELLAKLYEKKGDYTKAFKYQKSYSIYKDSLLNDTKIKELGQLEAKYEFDQEKQQLIFEQDKERLRLEKEKEVINTQLIATAAGLLFLLISVGIIVKAYREKAKANQKLHQLDQFKTRLFANINHDLRTPLTLMRGYIHRINTNKDDYLTNQTKEDLENLNSNALTMTEMTNEIQDLILLEEGKLELKLQKVEIISYLRRQVLMFGFMAEMGGIALKFECDIDSLPVNVDSNHIDKILYNLLSNAFKFTSKGGQIIVGLEEKNQDMILTISDTGKGIDSKDLPNIFDRFYQSPLNEYKSKEGYGIGLAVVEELVELHGGSIDVISEVDKGTMFTIVLPFNLDKKSIRVDVEKHSDKIPLPNQKSKKHMITSALDVPSILVVDDHAEIRKYIIDLISNEYVVKEAANGKQALKLLEIDKVDLIITDLMMPWLDGYDLIEKLKESEALRDIPVMVVSARTTEEDKHRVLDAGVNEFISKPFDPMMLQKRIKNLIADKADRKNTWEAITSDKSLQSNLEENILKKLNQIILDRISDSGLTIQVMAEELSASRSKAIRLIKELTGQTPLEYIKTIRMDFVQQAIKAKKIRNASEAASAIGMSNSTQFSSQYRKYFGENPFSK